MKAVIIAGGQGRRLLPHTKDKPKCLMTVHEKPILEYQFEALCHVGITDIAIVSGHCHDLLKTYTAQYNHPVTFIENTDFANTNNAYGIWLAKEFVADDPEGFLLINSDLVFPPEMLAFLMDSKEKDCIIIEKNTDPESDMVKIEMKGNDIIAMSKDIPPQKTSAEAVGPVKFSQEGGALFMEYLESFVKKNERNHWFFYKLGDFARDHFFAGIYNPGFVWAEIDTYEDLQLAHELINV